MKPAGEYLFENTGSASGATDRVRTLARRSFSFTPRSNHRQNASLERFGQRRPCVDHGHQVGVGIVALLANYVGFCVACLGKWRISRGNSRLFQILPPPLWCIDRADGPRTERGLFFARAIWPSVGHQCREIRNLDLHSIVGAAAKATIKAGGVTFLLLPAVDFNGYLIFSALNAEID